MRLVLACLLTLICALPLRAETAADILTANAELVTKASRQTIGPVIDALAASGDPAAALVLEAWADKRLGLRKSDGGFVLLTPDADGYALRDLAGADAGRAAKSEITELKPNAGVRGLIATALVQFTLSDPDPARRRAAAGAVAQNPHPPAPAPPRRPPPPATKPPP